MRAAVGGEQCCLTDRFSWPRKRGNLLPGSRVPDPPRAVPGGGDDPGAVGGKGRALQPLLVSNETEPLGTGRGRDRANAAPDGNPGPAARRRRRLRLTGARFPRADRKADAEARAGTPRAPAARVRSPAR